MISLVLASLGIVPGVAAADSSSSLTVVGTSDVSDSGLMQNVIQPAFEAQYPQFSHPFKYSGSATGQAISSAESGSGGASVLIVHAASLENQFLASGFSYNNTPGYAIFRNDFILAGPAGDPAGVNANASNDIVQAFADIATAGYNGGGTPKVSFYDRLGASGTTVEEHAIWQLVDSNGLRPAGLVLCVVNAANGGGEAPLSQTYASANSISDGQACPNSGAPPTATMVPSWYITANITQAPNVEAADACTGNQSGAGTCYVFTDRGTYDYLTSGSVPAIDGTISPDVDPHPLEILTRNDSASAPGGADLLVNYFHAYIINPSKPNETVNLTAAQDFINLLTSPVMQVQIRNYLDGTSDSGGAPFVPDASPILTESGLPKQVSYGSSVTVTGTLTNAEIGYPALASKKVVIDELEGGVPVAVASGTTNATGKFTIKFKPKISGSYQASTGEITQVENTTLSPQYIDTLSPAATASTYMAVKGTPAAHALGFKRVWFQAKQGGRRAVFVSGTLKPAPALKGAKVELLALSTRGGKQRRVGVATIGVGKTGFKLKALLAHGRYLLQLEYVQPHQTSSYSKLRQLTVR